MKREDIFDKFLNVRSWQNGGVRAPHKPLLLLYVLARFNEGQRNFIFAEIEDAIKNLLCDFGPSRTQYRVEYPFWRLQNDGIWEVLIDNHVAANQSGDVGRVILTDKNATGSFSEDIEGLLQDDSTLIEELVSGLLFQNFPESIHNDLLHAVGFHFDVEELIKTPRKRDHRFRENVLRAYNYSCAVCGFDVRVGHTPIALDAAHIKWHQAGGPDTEDNGLALCSLHHRLFDRGAFTISDNYRILISNMANGKSGFSEWLMKFNGVLIQEPQSKKYLPALQHTEWHGREVFQGKMRDI